MLALAQTVVSIQPGDVYFHVVSGCVHLLNLYWRCKIQIGSVWLIPKAISISGHAIAVARSHKIAQVISWLVYWLVGSLQVFSKLPRGFLSFFGERFSRSDPPNWHSNVFIRPAHARLFVWRFVCHVKGFPDFFITLYGILNATHWEIGYFDFIWPLFGPFRPPCWPSNVFIRLGNFNGTCFQISQSC